MKLQAAIIGFLVIVCGLTAGYGQATQPLVAIHDSELTRALETRPAVAPTPTGAGTTGFEWWMIDWHYFVMPEALKEALRSDGTAFTVVGDSNVSSGLLLTNGLPKYPIVISLASEAIRNDEIAQFTNYVAAGGFLFVGSSAFTRNTNGTTRGDFAFANELGVHMVNPNLGNWSSANNYFTKVVDHRIIHHFPSGQLTWRLPFSAEEISWGISPSHPFLAPHDIWKVSVGDATVLAQGDTNAYLTVKQYGKGYFIYCAAFQPLMAHGGFGPGMYSYVLFRRAIEWAFESASMPIPKISPWPYQYDAAFMVRHDLENFTNEIANIELSAAFEYTNNARGDYYFCTGALRDDASSGGYNTNSIVASLRRAVTNYGATIGPHNGGLKNPTNPALVRGDYDYWHWGPDEVLDVTPAGYPSGKAYATASISNSFRDVESWLSGINTGPRTWVACYFNATRDDSYDLQSQLNIKIIGDQKISPFPHWTLSTKTPGKRFAMLSEPVSDWFVGGLVAQSLEPWHPPGVHTSQTMHDAVDFYYGLGALINIYSHTMSTGLGGAGQLTPDYVTYGANTNLHPRLWSTNGIGVYQWWLQRSNAQITVSYSTNGSQSGMTFALSGASNPNTAVELLVPTTNDYCGLQVFTNGVLAGTNRYRTSGQIIRVLVGNTVNNAVVTYYPYSAPVLVFSENFDGQSAPALPLGWTTSATGAQPPWLTQAGTNDTAPNAAFSTNAASIGLNELVSPSIALPSGQAQLTFRNNYDLEAGTGSAAFDGGVLEIKIGTNAFTDILLAGGAFVSGGYAHTISSGSSNQLSGRQAWSGSSGGFISTVVTLPLAASGQSIQLRWRCSTDNSNSRPGWRIDSVTITSRACSCCGNNNTAPVLTTQADRTIVELSTLSVTNTASDADVPTNALYYNLINPPVGAVIDSNGLITWTPSEAQGPGTYSLTTVVTDNGFPALSVTNSFNVTVIEVNSAPTLPVQANRTVGEMTTLTVINTATDTDLPANNLSYSLLASPAGAAISANGVISWTPSEIQGPSTNTFTTRVVDDGSPALSATNSFTVVVTEVNVAPVLPTQADRLVVRLLPMTVTNSATDADIPLNSLSYSLQAGPTNASISPAGIITWTPTAAQEGTTNLFRTVVTDDGLPPLSATNSFLVTVNSDPKILLNSTTLVLEGCSGTNNAIDPGEGVTVLFELKNTGLVNSTNLTATLLATNGVVSPGGPQNYGVLLAGGTPVSLPFSFAATGACGGTITATLKLQDGNLNLGTVTAVFQLGQLATVFSENFDGVTAPALPAGWTTSATNAASNWRTTNSLASSAPNAVFSADALSVGLNELVSPSIVLPLGAAQLSFSNYYNLEIGTNGFDGGVLEIKIGTNAFVDILAAGGTFVSGAYNTSIDTHWSNPLAGRLAWSGTNSSYIPTIVNMPGTAAGQTIQLRWRCGTDTSNGGGGWRIDSINLTARACCANSPPTLPTQINRTVDELTALVVTNTAFGPGKQLSYALLNPPAGAQIDTNGIITWTPTEAQGPGTNIITTVVTDNGAPPLSATNSFTVVVNEINSPPALPAQIDRTMAELTLLIVTNTAVDFDLPVNMLTYALLDPPAGAVIDSNGLITWIPTEAQGPSTNTITTVVTDDGVPALSQTNAFQVIVLEVNSAPSLPPQTNRTVAASTLLIVTNTATDADLPANSLNYFLISPPAGALIDTNGIITWTPTEDQEVTAQTITTVVSDDGVPALTATNTFEVTVTGSSSSLVILSLSMTNDSATLIWSAKAGRTYQLQYLDDLSGTNWTPVPPDVTATGATAIKTDLIGGAVQRFYRISIMP